MSLPHWEYFLAIEEDLARCARYVEFAPSNFGTYSLEFARIIVAAASEFDVIAKRLCHLIDSSAGPTKINEYRPVIVGRYPRFLEFTVDVPRHHIELQPWSSWTEDQSPDWWSKSYNKIKHQRDEHFAAANLKNALNATAGLLIGLMYLYDAQHGEVEVDYLSMPKLLAPRRHPGQRRGSVITEDLSVWK